MAAVNLTMRERAVLFTLVTEQRPLDNATMKAVGGVTLEGASRLKLNDLKLVTSTKIGRSFVHELADDGGAWCRAELTAERPSGAGSIGGALYAVLGGLGRYLKRSGLALTDVFGPEPDDLERRVRSAYERIGGGEGWITLTSLREELSDVRSSSPTGVESANTDGG